MLEDNVVNERLLAALRSTLGLEGSDRELVEAFRTALPEDAPSLDVLLETWDDRNVPAGYSQAQV